MADGSGKGASPMHIVLGCIQVNPVKYHVSKIPKPQIAESPPPPTLHPSHSEPHISLSLSSPARAMQVQTSAANRLIGEVVQSRRRPLLGPSPG